MHVVTSGDGQAEAVFVLLVLLFDISYSSAVFCDQSSVLHEFNCPLLLNFGTATLRPVIQNDYLFVRTLGGVSQSYSASDRIVVA